MGRVLDPSRLSTALEIVIHKHDILRTRFLEPRGTPIQSITNVPGGRLIDCTGLIAEESGEKTAAIGSVVEEHRQLGTDLFRLLLFQLESSDSILCVVIHHLISDGWSVDVLVDELVAEYDLLVGGKGRTGTTHPGVQYRDYVSRQAALQATSRWDYANEARRRSLEKAVHLAFPSDKRVSKPLPSGDAHAHRFSLDIETGSRILGLCSDLHLTPFVFMVGILEMLLLRWTGCGSFPIVLTMSGRVDRGLENVIGPMVASIPIRACSDTDAPARDFIRLVRDACYEAFRTQDVYWRAQQFPENAVPAVGVEMRNRPPWETLSLDSMRFEKYFARYPIELHLSSRGNAISGNLLLQCQYFRDDTGKSLVSAFQTLIDSTCGDLGARVSTLNVMAPVEKTRIDTWSRGLTVNHRRGMSVGQLIDEAAQTRGSNPALRDGDEVATYSDLVRRSSQVANWLVKEVQGNGPVAVAVGPSVQFGILLLGILKAGRPYLPIDVEWPESHVRRVVAHARSSLMLADASTGQRLQGLTLTVCDDRWWGALCNEASGHFDVRNRNHSLAYVNYTSGSTGLPKPAAIGHDSVISLIEGLECYCPISPGDRVALASSPAFDVTTFELWGTLVNGAEGVVIPKVVLLSPDGLRDFIVSQAIDVLFLTSAVFHLISAHRPDAFRTVKHLLVGGDVLDPGAVNSVFEAGPPGRFVHVYGPTETTTFATSLQLRGPTPTDWRIPIGSPVPNAIVRVVDEQGEVLPPTFPGEILIGGLGVAHGYFNEPELTESRFVSVETEGRPARFYRTGDRGRWIPPGYLEFLGRQDSEVKIRGMRVDLSALEGVLTKHPAVCEAVVMADKSNSSEGIVAGVVVRGKVDVSDLLNGLRRAFPSQAVPRRLVKLQSIPLTPNGKVDREALSSIINRPATQRETRDSLAGFLRDGFHALGLQGLAVEEDIFHRGADSMLAARFVAQIREDLRIPISVRDIYETRTCSSLAALMRQRLQDPHAHESLADVNGVRLLETARARGVQPEEKDRAKLGSGGVGRDTGIHSRAPILTGATGFVGSFILQALLQDAGLQHVDCLVRAPDETSGRTRLMEALRARGLILSKKEWDKVRVVSGDAQAKRFGLTPDRWMQLGRRVDSVIHCAARVDVFDSLDALWSPNVEATWNCLALSEVNPTISFHYISSMSVPGMLPIAKEDVVDPETRFRSGYVQSKWLSEHLTIGDCGRTGRAFIYRLPRVLGHSRTGHWNYTDVLYRLILAAVKTGRLPEADYEEICAPVDWISHAVAHLIRAKYKSAPVMNVTPSEPIRMSDVAHALASEGIVTDLIPVNAWREQMLTANVVAALPILWMFDRPRTQPTVQNARAMALLSGTLPESPDVKGSIRASVRLILSESLRNSE